MRKSIKDLLGLELRFVGKSFTAIYPVAQIDPWQFKDLCQFDLVEQGVGPQREVSVIWIVIEVDRRDTVIQNIDEIHPD